MPTIKLTNDVLLDATSLKAGPDFSNVLASGLTSYTTTQNCYVEVQMTGGSNTLYIDDHRVSGYNYYELVYNYLSKGSTMRLDTPGNAQRITAFGFK